MSKAAPGDRIGAAGQLEFAGTLADNLVEGIYAMDREGRLTYLNPAAEKMFGWKQQDILGKPVHETIHYQKADGTPYPAEECRLTGVIRDGLTIASHEDYFTRADGSIFPALCTSSPIFSDNRIVGAVLTFNDISQKREADVLFSRAQEEALAANRQLDAIRQIQAKFITGENQWDLWEEFIRQLLELTDCEYGYIGEIFYKESGDPYLVFRGLTNIAWNPETRALFEGLKTRGLEFHNLESLYGYGLKDGGRTVIANDPVNDPRRTGLPQGHPALKAFMGIPVYGYNGQLIAQIGLANRPGGFTERDEELLKPVIVSASYIIEAYRNLSSRQKAEQELQAQYQLMQTLTENATAALFMMDTHGHCTFMNQAAVSMTGYQLDEMQGKSLHDCIHHTRPDGSPYPVEECPIDRALPERNQIRGHEDLFIRKDGQFFPVACSAQPIIRDGEPVGTVVEVRDLTEEKKARQAIVESEERFRTLANSAPIKIWMTDAEGKNIYFNNTWLKFTGRPLEQDLSNTWDLIHPDDLEASQAIFKKALREHTPFEMESRFKRHDGQYRWLLSVGSPRTASSSEGFSGFVGSSLDITERRQAREELERQVAERTAQLTVSNRELEAFCYSVSHDLRAPLRGIDGFSQALLEDYADKLDSVGERYLNQVRLESQKMGQLIEDMLRLSKVTRAELQMSEVDLSALAEETLAALSRQEPERKVDVRIQPGMTTHADRALLASALFNLLGNAWKFTSRNPEAAIEFGSCQQQGRTVYFIKDNGVGFDMAYAGKLFGAFQRLHAMTDFPGTGIGLATVQRIIHRHGGEIRAESEVAKGTTFYFTIGDYSVNPSN